MRREVQIPLFLWIATALVVHALGGEGATTVVERLEETLDIEDFANQVRRQASYAGPPVEVTLLDDEHDLNDLLEPDPEPDAKADVPPPEEKPDGPLKKEPPAKEEAKKKQAAETQKSAPKPQQPKPEPEKKLDTPPPPQPQPKPPTPVDNRRVAVEQDVQDKNQENDESAQFAGEYANRVKEQTRAQISASDGASSQAQMGGPSSNAGPDVGNSQKNNFAQSEESKGRPDDAPGDNSEGRTSHQTASPAQIPNPATQAAQNVSGSPNQKNSAAQPNEQGQKALDAQAAMKAEEAAPETYAVDGGSYAMAKARKEQSEMIARAAQRAIAGRTSSDRQAMMGLGANNLTPRGFNLNLSYTSAQTILGADHLAQVRKKNGERRLSEHRGSWQSLGLERWRPALENYVANVKPGNQTALNTAAVPFARYLNQIHQRLHEIFADRFLGHLDQLPANHPLNNQEMSTHLEIALSPEDGSIVRMGITKSSGVTAFDVGALDSVQRAAPYGPPPDSIRSSDGNVYLHWEFHRRPEYACSTYFARPFIIDVGQKSTPPTLSPPAAPPNEQPKAPTSSEKRGSLNGPTNQKLKPG